MVENDMNTHYTGPQIKIDEHLYIRFIKNIYTYMKTGVRGFKTIYHFIIYK